MFKFLSKRNSVVSECSCSIERKTNLLVVEQKNDHEEWPRYIRLTGQQVDRIKQMFFKGGFSSATRPINSFSLEGNIITMCCRSENQVIRMTIEEMGNVFRYYEIHRERIARFDKDFRSFK